MIQEIIAGFSENKALIVVAVLVLIDIGLIISRFFYGVYSFRRASKRYAEEMIQSEERMKAVIGHLNDQHSDFVNQLSHLQTSLENDISEPN